MGLIKRWTLSELMLRSNDILEFDALGTHWWCEPLGQSVISEKLRQAIDATVNDFTNKYSRFNSGSLVGQLNSAGIIDNPPQEMIEMMNYARQMFIETDGVFNISVGGILNSFGYGDRKFAADISDTIWQEVVISPDRITIPKSITIDFGGFGKGWLIDQLSDLFIKNNVNEYIINGGGDIYVNSSKLIELGLEHPYDCTKVIGTTRITRGALAVSSIVKRSWKNGDKSYHHIINPMGKKPSDNDVIASYVRAETALIADTMATCLIIKPQLKDKLAKKYKIEVILINHSQLLETK
jgi:thiamine biosynthesis lipoprotein